MESVERGHSGVLAGEEGALMHLRSKILVCLLAGPMLLVGAVFGERPAPPPYYAIRGATVVTGTGQTIENGTVVIADGLIEAVGENVTVPADAWEVDGTGMTLYPGLIDAMTDLGLRAGEDDDDEGRGGGRGGGPPGSGGPEIRGPEDRPKTTPWVTAADALGTSDARVARWREAGFTAALAVPGDGFFAGQAAVIALAGDEADDMVVASPVAMHVQWQGRPSFRTYPGSLMGRLSYVKQVLSDARHEAAVDALYRADPPWSNPSTVRSDAGAAPRGVRSRAALLDAGQPQS